MTPLTPPDTSPTAFETFAVTEGYPPPSSVGNVTSEPEPTIVLTMPATPPAASTARYSPAVTRTSLGTATACAQHQHHRGDHRERQRAVREELRRVLEGVAEGVADADQQRAPGRGSKQAEGQEAAQPHPRRTGGERRDRAHDADEAPDQDRLGAVAGGRGGDPVEARVAAG